MHISFVSTIQAIIKVLLLIILGAYLYRLRWLTQEVLSFLTNFLVKIAVPCLVFSSMLAHKDFFGRYPWGFFIISSIVIFVLGLLISGVTVPWRKFAMKREFIMLVTFQNCGYLPMNLSLFLFPQEMHKSFLVSIFIYLVGFNILLWAWGVFFLSRRKFSVSSIKYLLTPPVVSTVLSFLVINAGWSKFIPRLVIDTTSVIGQSTFLLSMLVLGGMLFRELGSLDRRDWGMLSLAGILKLIVLPSVLVFVIGFFSMPFFLKMFLIIQAAMPSAASLPIIASYAHRDTGFISKGVFLTHILSILTIPLWLGFL